MNASKLRFVLGLLAGLGAFAMLGAPQRAIGQSDFCSQNAPACKQAMQELDSNSAEFNKPTGATEQGGRAECERYYRNALADLASFFKETIKTDMANNKKLTKQQAMWYETKRYFGITFARLQQEEHTCAQRPYGIIAEPQ